MYNQKQLENAADYLIIAAKECGYTTPEQIEENFDSIVIMASSMIEKLRKKYELNRVSSNPISHLYAARYQQEVLKNQ